MEVSEEAAHHEGSQEQQQTDEMSSSTSRPGHDDFVWRDGDGGIYWASGGWRRRRREGVDFGGYNASKVTSVEIIAIHQDTQSRRTEQNVLLSHNPTHAPCRPSIPLHHPHHPALPAFLIPCSLSLPLPPPPALRAPPQPRPCPSAHLASRARADIPALNQSSPPEALPPPNRINAHQTLQLSVCACA